MVVQSENLKVFLAIKMKKNMFQFFMPYSSNKLSVVLEIGRLESDLGKPNT